MSNANGGNGTNGGGTPASGGPKSTIADSLSKPLAKRFYKEVTVSDGAFHQVQLDGRPIKTPGKRALMLPTRALADLIAAEWAAQTAAIDPSTMPLTRFANTAIDAVSAALEEVAADLAAYAGRDLLCYRAQDQENLARKQAEAWDPVLAWARSALGAPFIVTAGVMPIEQPPAAIAAFASALEPHEPFKLTALHVMTTLTGSAILALAHAKQFLDRDSAWRIAHVDEDYQIALWGEDYEASEKRKVRAAEFEAASKLLTALSTPGR